VANFILDKDGVPTLYLFLQISTHGCNILFSNR